MTGLTEEIRRSNKQLMKSIYPKFREEIAQGDCLFSDFCRIADCFENFLFSYALNDRVSSHYVAGQLSRVLDKCDFLEFTVWEAYAYAIMHFLERYRRFQQIYLSMLKEGLLPVRRKTANILDVGTGPAVALYSLFDVSELLKAFGNKNNIDLINNINFEFDYVERSDGFRHFLHIFTELNLGEKRYPVPFHFGTFREFKGLNFQHEKNKLQQRLIDEEMNYYDGADEPISRGFAQQIVDQENGQWRDACRYNMIVFSNFLTSPSQVDDNRNELASSFRALRNGGTIIFVGASFGKYPEIYNRLKCVMNAIGKKECKLAFANSNMSHRLDDPCSQRIRVFYMRILKHFTDLGEGNNIPEKAKKHIEEIIANDNGNGNINWSLYIFQKQLKKHY